jgi:hypothetical protein
MPPSERDPWTSLLRYWWPIPLAAFSVLNAVWAVPVGPVNEIWWRFGFFVVAAAALGTFVSPRLSTRLVVVLTTCTVFTIRAVAVGAAFTEIPIVGKRVTGASLWVTLWVFTAIVAGLAEAIDEFAPVRE